MSRDVDMKKEDAPNVTTPAFRDALKNVGQPPKEAPITLLTLPSGFDQDEALVAVAEFVAAQLHAGLSKREIMHRLHGYQRTEGE